MGVNNRARRAAKRHQHVDDARDRLFPQAVRRETTVSNGQGWAAAS
jgi:hypothetical protein